MTDIRPIVITALLLATIFVVSMLMIIQARGDSTPCHEIPANDGQEWHYRTKVDDDWTRICWYAGKRMRPRSELYWVWFEPVPLPTPKPIIDEEFEDRWRGIDDVDKWGK